MVQLNDEQKKKLLALARKTIEEYLKKRTLPKVDYNHEFADDVFKQKCGAFVTLHKHGALRGCIGYVKGIKTIPEAVVDMAKAAAFEDPRFEPLQKHELDDIDIEISVLTPVEHVNDVGEIVIGRDGLIISNGFRAGLLLPQVATEYGWDVQTFLQHTCYKAGLPADAWKWENTKIEKFSAIVFGEKELNLR
ncbi:MAG: AmmeMemoRadiSam system protein A [Spirochaetota bacterium]